MTTEKVATTRIEDDRNWDKIKQEITCSICYELFTDPRTLPCLHTFCKSCIQTTVETGLAEVPEGYFECPLCRAHVPLPANGIDGISANFSTKRLIEIYQKRQEIATVETPKCRVCVHGNSATMWCIECDCPVCNNCSISHRSLKVFSQHKVIPMKEFTSNPKRAIEVSLNPGACPSHPDQVLKFYCYTCDQTICVECALLDHPRGEHKFDSISKIIVAEKEEVLKTAAPLEPMRASVCEAMTRAAASKDDISTRYQVNVAEVNSLVDELHRTLDQQRKVILKKLELFKTASHKSLDMQSSDLAFLESKLKSCREFVHNLIDKSNAAEILSFKTQIAGRVADLTSLMDQAPLEPVCTADSTVWCIDPAKFVIMCQSLCHVFCSPHPPHCTIDKSKRHYIQVDGNPVNVVTVTISLKDIHGNPVPKQAQHLGVTSDQVNHLTVEEQDKDGVYKMTYQPAGVAAHTVIIKWSGHDINQCDIPGLMRDYTTLKVDIPVEVDDEIVEQDDKSLPDKLLVMEEQSVDNGFNANRNQGIVTVEVPVLGEQDIVENNQKNDDNELVDQPVHGQREGKQNIDTNDGCDQGIKDHLQVLVKYGPDEEELGEIFGLASGPNDELIVSDYLNDKLIVFDKDLQYMHTIGEGEFWDLYGIACNDVGQVFAADGCNRIQVFKLSGEFVTMFGTEGKEDGEFDQPNGLALSSTGLLFVGDLGNQRVQVFDTNQNNKFLYSFGQDKPLYNHIKLALNATEDKLFITDRSSSVEVFTPQGQFLHSLILDPSQCGVIPFCVHCTPDGHLLVSTLVSTSFLSVYHEDGTFVTAPNRKRDPFKFFLENADGPYTEDNFAGAIHMRKNGQIVIGFHNYYDIFDSNNGIVLL